MQLPFEGLVSLKLTTAPVTDGHAPYIICNEQQQSQTLSSLSPFTSTETIHVGFSGLFNLDIIAVTQPKYAVILDIDPQMHAVYEILNTALIEASTRVSFIDKFQSALANDVRGLLQFPTKYMKQVLLKELTKVSGFLSSETSYALVHTMVIESRIFFGNADITDTSVMDQLNEWIIAKNLTVHTLYLSNIPEWIIEHSTSGQNKENMKQNLEKLISPTTQIIDAFYPTRTKNGGGPPQRIHIGELPSFSTKQASSKENILNRTVQPLRQSGNQNLRSLNHLTIFTLSQATSSSTINANTHLDAQDNNINEDKDHQSTKRLKQSVNEV